MAASNGHHYQQLASRVWTNAPCHSLFPFTGAIGFPRLCQESCEKSAFRTCKMPDRTHLVHQSI